MEYRNLGRSGLKVSSMSLGTNAFGGRASEEASMAVIHRAIDGGINLIDTADVYPGSESERIIGKALKDRRHQVVLATKAVFRTGPDPTKRAFPGSTFWKPSTPRCAALDRLYRGVVVNRHPC